MAKEHELGAGLWLKSMNWGAGLGEDFLGLLFSVPVSQTLERLYSLGLLGVTVEPWGLFQPDISTARWMLPSSSGGRERKDSQPPL